MIDEALIKKYINTLRTDGDSRGALINRTRTENILKAFSTWWTEETERVRVMEERKAKAAATRAAKKAA